MPRSFYSITTKFKPLEQHTKIHLLLKSLKCVKPTHELGTFNTILFQNLFFPKQTLQNNNELNVTLSLM
jgi:hypothetical protein